MRHPAPRLFALGGTLLLSLVACIGTLEAPLPVTLAVADRAGARLAAVNVGALSATTTVAPVPVVQDNRTPPVVGLATVQNGRRIAVAYANRVEFLDLALNVTASILPARFENCAIVKMRADAAGGRLALLVNCGAGVQQLRLFDTNGVERLAFTFDDLFQFPASEVHLAPFGEGLVVARPTNITRTVDTVFRIDVDGPDANTDPDVTPLLPASANTNVNDLAVQSGTVYVGTDAGVFSVANNTTVATLITGRSTRVFANGSSPRLLAAFNPTSGTLVVSNFTTLFVYQGFLDIRDATFAPDGYLYLLQPSSLSRLDTARLNTFQSTATVSTPSSYSQTDGRALTWVLP